MRQIRFEWPEQVRRSEPSGIELGPETTEAVIALMARSLIAIVRATEESADER